MRHQYEYLAPMEHYARKPHTTLHFQSFYFGFTHGVTVARRWHQRRRRRRPGRRARPGIRTEKSSCPDYGEAKHSRSACAVDAWPWLLAAATASSKTEQQARGTCSSRSLTTAVWPCAHAASRAFGMRLP
jgi:hypothetical protein